MSFTRRNVAIRSSSSSSSSSAAAGSAPPPPPTSSTTAPASPAAAPRRLPGTRPSPVDGRAVTSTGCLSFDGLLAGHAGLALGTSVLVEEAGTTDYASTLLRYFAAEGVVQGHAVHVIGLPEAWGRELPAAVGPAHAGGDRSEQSAPNAGKAPPSDRMKIAWRYERLGEFGAGNTQARSSEDQDQNVFCHAFDLTKRLTFPSANAISFIPLSSSSSSSAGDPFPAIQAALAGALASSAPETVHRIVMPSLLSPAIYAPRLCDPGLLLPFLHGLRALLRRHAGRAVLMFSLPVTLYPRASGLTRWIEHAADGVVELVPFPHRFDNDTGTGTGGVSSSLATSGAATAAEERPQGMLHVHRLPVFHERGGGGTGAATGVDDDLAFTVSRRRFAIKPFSLPPVEGDTEAQGAAVDQPARGAEGKERKLPRKEDLEF